MPQGNIPFQATEVYRIGTIPYTAHPHQRTFPPFEGMEQYFNLLQVNPSIAPKEALSKETND